ncbi:hypothetical protein BGW36DRAFT_385957 [Talaromyces proteolyticus]|uniref:Uncharacterized protein n=1 Tax=Talaromyces proteolyticus TaxID=1131652 RepID=A0AAD4KPK4_9EURO|nr:uncharacterized protein BGW36DRAFT_385957 [Talaromyces proteolyticus]KAH8693141.1 hypothetical protein BGW36DRAFT_385957 [Talaromyces proteolyticus]
MHSKACRDVLNSPDVLSRTPNPNHFRTEYDAALFAGPGSFNCCLSCLDLFVDALLLSALHAAILQWRDSCRFVSLLWPSSGTLNVTMHGLRAIWIPTSYSEILNRLHPCNLKLYIRSTEISPMDGRILDFVCYLSISLCVISLTFAMLRRRLSKCTSSLELS